MAFGQTLGSKGMFSLLIFRNSWHNIPLSFSYHFQPLHLSLVAIAAAALPSFVLPNCLVYWTFLASFGFFGLVSTPMSQKIHLPIRLQVTGSLVGCTSPVLVSLLGLPALSPAFGLVSHPHLLLLKTATAVLLIFTINPQVTAFRGVAALLGPPSAGQDWETFFISSLFFFFSG